MVYSKNSSLFCPFLVLIVVSWQISVVTFGQYIISAPANTSALVGSEAQLNCSASLNGRVLFWYYYPEGAGQQEVYASVNNVTNDESLFGIEIDVSAGEYNLIVKSVELSLGTRYECAVIPDPQNQLRREARLVAITPLECPVAGSEHPQGTVIDVQCRVQHNGGIGVIVPHLNWTDSSGVELGTNSTTDGSNSTYALLTVKLELDASYDDQELTCWLDYEASSPDQQHTMPTYTDSCTTSFLVTHPVSDIQLSVENIDGESDFPALEVGDVINCTANGRPAPTYMWISEDTGIDVSNESVLEITTDMMSSAAQTYTCNATNIFINEPSTVSKSVTFYVAEIAPPDSGVETWIIVVAVVVPVVVIVAVVLGVFFGVRHQRKEKKKKKADKLRSQEMSRPVAASKQQNTFTARPNIGQPQPTSQVASYNNGPNLATRQISGVQTSRFNDYRQPVIDSEPEGFPVSYVLPTRVPRPQSASTLGSGYQPSYTRPDYDPSGDTHQPAEGVRYDGPQPTRSLISGHNGLGYPAAVGHQYGDTGSFGREAVVMNPNPNDFRQPQQPVQFIPRSRDSVASSTGTSV